MKNDLLPIERNLLRILNLREGTNYNYKNLMEWSSDEKTVKRNLQSNEIMYEIDGHYVAIKENNNER